MKAMILKNSAPIEDNPLQLDDIPRPVPDNGQIRIKISVCGACHTDLHTVEGELDLPKLPLVPGHQIVGRVDELGKSASRFKAGDRVGVAWLNKSCGQCDYCRNDQENLCRNAQFTGLHANGGYAEYTVVDENYAYPIPENFPDENASLLLCAGIIGYRSLRLSNLPKGGNLGLYGFGASAHIVIQVARYWNCNVFVFTRSENHKLLARDLGAVWVGEADEQPPKKLDSGITFAPSGKLIPLALSHLKPAGTLAINAIYMSPIPKFEYPLIYEERKLQSVAHVTRRDAEEFLPLASKIPVKTEVQSYPLEKANHVLKLMKDSKLKAAAALKV